MRAAANRTAAIGGSLASGIVQEIPAIFGDPQPAAGRAKGEELAGLVDRERMSPHQIVGVALWQSLA